MSVRIAKDTDFDFVKNLWAEAFGDSSEFIEWNFKHNYKSQDTVIAFDNGAPASAMQLMPYKASLFGQSVCCRYISGVSTTEEFKHRGNVRKLFEFALPHMYSKNQCLSLLFPAVDGMYEKFGYQKVAERFEYKIKSPCISSAPISKLVEKLDSIYKANMAGKKFYIDRSPANFEHILTDLITLSGGGVCFTDDGYLLAFPKSDDGEFFTVAEACTPAPPQMPSNPTFPLMVRIVNLKEFLNICKGNISLSDTLTVKDEYIPQNNITFTIGTNEIIYDKGQGKIIGIDELCLEIFKQIDSISVNLMY